MTKKLCALLLFTFVNLNSNISPKGFEEFNYNNYFVETGTYDGQGIEYAMRAGFKEIRSIDINPGFYRNTQKNFLQYSQVKFYLGDSGTELYNVIKDINEPITFWLDAHSDIPDKNGGKNTPLMEELEQLKKHHIKTHTILIDDMHCTEGILFDYLTKDQIIEKILEINSHYHISYRDGGNEGEYKNNVMVAQVKN